MFQLSLVIILILVSFPCHTEASFMLANQTIEDYYPEMKNITLEGLKKCFQPYSDPTTYESVVFKPGATFQQFIDEYFSVHPDYNKILADYDSMMSYLKLIFRHLVRCSWTDEATNPRKFHFKAGFSRLMFGEIDQRGLLRVGAGYVPPEDEKDTFCKQPMPLEAPERYDFREHYNFTYDEVRFQGDCGACYAITSASMVEAAHLKKNQSLKGPLSPQFIIDFSTENFGCNGGAAEYTFEFIKKKGLPFEEEYPYKEKATDLPRPETSVHIKDFCYMSDSTEEMRKKFLVNFGPLWTIIDGSDKLFHLYKSGIYYSDVAFETYSHALLVVGYDEDSWILRNSWGRTYGENGYVRVARKHNLKTIAPETAYFVV